MAQFLITCLDDEGMYTSSFVVTEAPSRLAIAAHMLAHPSRWEQFLWRAYEIRQPRAERPTRMLWELVSQQLVTPEELLALIDETRLDGDSEVQVRIWEVAVEPLEKIETDPWKRGIYKSLAPAVGSAQLEPQLSNPEPADSSQPTDDVC